MFCKHLEFASFAFSLFLVNVEIVLHTAMLISIVESSKLCFVVMIWYFSVRLLESAQGEAHVKVLFAPGFKHINLTKQIKMYLIHSRTKQHQVLPAERLKYRSDLRLQALSQWKLESFTDVMWSFSVDAGGHAVIAALLLQLSLQ